MGKPIQVRNKSLRSQELNQLYANALAHEEALYKRMKDYHIIDKEDDGSNIKSALKKGVAKMLGMDKGRQDKYNQTKNADDAEINGLLDQFEKDLRAEIYNNPDSFISMQGLSQTLQARLDPKLNKAGTTNEIFSYDSIARFLNQEFPKATIYGTAPRQTENSTRYDIKVTVPWKGADDDTESKKGRQNLEMEFENKIGVSNNPNKANFHFGQFSSSGLYNEHDRKDTYSMLKKYMETSAFNQGNVNGYVNDNGDLQLDIHIAQTDVVKAIGDNLVVSYLRWRLENHFPFFINAEGNVLLCSEVINFMNSHNKTSYDMTTNDREPFTFEAHLNEVNATGPMEMYEQICKQRDKICQTYTSKIMHDFRIDLSYGKMSKGS